MNIKIYLLTLVFLLIRLVGVCQTLPTRAQQYQFLKWYLKNQPAVKLSKKLDHFENEIVSLSDFDGLNDTPEMKYSNFKVVLADLSYIKTQLIKNNQIKRLEKDSLQDIDWHRITDPDLPVTHISLPVFSADLNTVFIEKYFHCGSLCGNGGYEIYRKTDGKWQRFKVAFWAKWNN